MSFSAIISFISAVFGGVLGVIVLLRDRRSLVHRTFFAGMIALAAEAVFTGVTVLADSPDAMIYWQRFRLIIAAPIPGFWLLFSFSFARENYKVFQGKTRWLTFACFVIPLLLVTVFNRALFTGDAFLNPSSEWLFPLDWSGYVLHICFLLAIVIVLMNLEKSLRTSTGHIRWQIKFMLLGVGSLFAVRIYTGSQTLLFRTLNLSLEVVNAGMLIIAGVLMMRALFRMRVLSVDLHPSYTLLYNSITVLIVGIYFIVVGIVAQLVRHFNGGSSLPIKVFLTFLAFLLLTIFLLSDRARLKTKRFLSLHLKRPRYDYRKEWTTFTQKTARITEVKDLCAAVAKMLSQTMEVLSVTLWLVDEKEERLQLGGSTVFSESQAGDYKLSEKEGVELIRAMKGQELPVDLKETKAESMAGIRGLSDDRLKKARIRYCLPLTAGGALQGIMTLDDRVGREAFSLEDLDLLKTISDQAAAGLFNLKLSEQLRQAREMEAFQTMSTFVVHDLKNVASTLSLTMENLPIHFDNPEFRGDAFRVISQSVERIKGMCSSLYLLRQELDLKQTPVDLNQFVASALSRMGDYINTPLVQDLQPLPEVLLDSEQMEKVLANLVLNATEASENGGEIRVVTQQQGNWALVQVCDHGCGMSKEFMEKSLFRPFKTTKKQGMGIGLFHSKRIVEAHRGRIEVESEEGKGTTFKVFLPLGGK